MLIWLFELFSRYFHAFHVVQYITLRSILATLTALIVSLLVGPSMIRRLSLHKVGQVVRDDGPQSHLSKAGTPTMAAPWCLLRLP